MQFLSFAQAEKTKKAKANRKEESERKNVWYLIGRNRPAGIVSHDSSGNAPNRSASISAPDEVKAGLVDEEFVFTGRDRRRNQRLGVGDAFVSGGLAGSSDHGLLDTEEEEDEEQGGEEL